VSLLDTDQREKLGVGLDLAGRLLGELLPGLSGPVARGLLGAVREVLRSGREPEEIVAHLRRLTERGAARLELDAEVERVAEELKRGLG
jgi:hypothetical protein